MPGLEERLVKNALSKCFDGDWFDRLSHRYSTLLLICVSLLVRGNQIVSDKIKCFTPTEFTCQQTAYVNDYCYVANTYSVPDNELLPGPGERRKLMINYYQWVSWFFLIQSVLFLIPVLLWRQTDISSLIDGLVRSLHDISDKSSLDNRRNTIKELVLRTQGYLMSHAAPDKISCFKSVRYWKILRYSTSIFNFFIKLIYLSNSIGQLFLVNKFLGRDGFMSWGWTCLSMLFEEGELPLSDIFPVATFCDVTLRRIGHNSHHYVMQCTLPLNLFHDRVFLGIWIWLFFTLIMTSLGIILWCKLHWCNDGFILAHLRHKNRCREDRDSPILQQFISHYLSCDGVFLLKVVYRNTSCAEFDMLLAGLWDHFMKNHRGRGRMEYSDSISMVDHGRHGYKGQTVAVNMDGDGYESSVIL